MNQEAPSSPGPASTEADTAHFGPPYARAVVVHDLVWTSGHLPTGPDGSMPAEFADQVEVAIDNLERTLHEAGADLSRC